MVFTLQLTLQLTLHIPHHFFIPCWGCRKILVEIICPSADTYDQSKIILAVHVIIKWHQSLDVEADSNALTAQLNWAHEQEKGLVHLPTDKTEILAFKHTAAKLACTIVNQLDICNAQLGAARVFLLKEP